MDFSTYFHKGDEARGNFLARFLGIINEEIARIYFASACSEKYTDIGRPTIKEHSEERGSTLDFVLQEKKDGGKIYIAEMKCEMAFENYKYMEINSIDDIEHHIKNNKKAFMRFLDCANNAVDKYIIKVNKDFKRPKWNPVEKADGIILIWGKVTKDAQKLNAIKEKYHFADILSLEDMINKMVESDCKEYKDFILERKNWVNNFLDGIVTKV